MSLFHSTFFLSLSFRVVYALAWSETNEFHLAFASGDGSVRLWDLKSNQLLRNYAEHTAEVYSVDWNLKNKVQSLCFFSSSVGSAHSLSPTIRFNYYQTTFISGAWDNLVKLWHPEATRSVRTFKEHKHCVYSTVWHPKNADLFASTSGDGTLKIWDCNGKLIASTMCFIQANVLCNSLAFVVCLWLTDEKSVQTINAHNFEILTCDWNKYNEFVVATGSVDKTIRIWVSNRD
jgi:peroxin-7